MIKTIKKLNNNITLNEVAKRYLNIGFIYPIDKLRDNIQYNYGEEYYAIRLNDIPTASVLRRIEKITKGKRVNFNINELNLLSIRLGISGRKVNHKEKIYVLVDNMLFYYKVDVQSYLKSRSMGADYTYGTVFNLHQIYLINQDKISALKILGKDKDAILASKLIDTEYATEMITLVN